MRVNPFVKLYWPYTFGLIILGIYFLPYLILGENSFIRIHDNLDGELIYRIKLSQPHGAIFPEIMNGLPVSAMLTKYNGLVLLFYLFPPFYAYMINEILAKAVGFIGMYVLVTRFVIPKSPNQNLIAFGVAICFAVIPFSNIFSGLTMAGIPLIIFLFLLLLNNKAKWWIYFLLLLFAFYSSLVISGLFLLISLTIIWVIHAIKEKKANYNYLLGLVLLSCGYLISESQLIASYLFSSEFISHRTEMQGTLPEFSTAFNSTYKLFTKNHYHTGQTPTLLIIIIGSIALAKNRLKDKVNNVLVICIVLTCLFYGIYPFIKYYLGNSIPLINSFQWDRFYFLLPTLWFMFFARSVHSIVNKKSTSLIAGILIIQFIVIIKSSDYYLKNLAPYSSKNVNFPSYNQFYDQDLFEQINIYIGKNKANYRMVSLGMHPAASQYNGFYTLDAYITNYPVSYKESFRKVIANELDKDEQLKDYFDNWGNRCYIFSSELGKHYLFNKNSDVEIVNLDINVQHLKNMGCEYLISAVPINNYQSIGLNYERPFESSDSFYKIFLYSISEAP